MAAPRERHIKLWTREDEEADAEFFGKVKVGDAKSYAALRERLEAANVLDWSFDFWDSEEGCRVRKRIEALNDIEENVHVIASVGLTSQTSKRRRVENEMPTQMEPMLQTEVAVEISAEPLGSSRVSGDGDGHNNNDISWKSTVISKDLMERYLRQAEKFRRDLKDVSLEDNEWVLKSWDQDGVGIVKIFCTECHKDCGSDSGSHTNAVIANLFSNFKTSHLQSAQHIRNWCRKHNVNFLDHPASVATKGKSVPLSPPKHKKLIEEGVSMMEGVNSELPEGVLQFTVVGDVDIPNPKSYWFKVRCPYCRDLLSLCPPKRNLEANLRNHMAGSKHMTAVEEARTANLKSTGLRTGRRGRPSQSTSTSAHSNQPDLHSWLMMASRGTEAGMYSTSAVDANFLKGLMCWGFRDEHCRYNGLAYAVRGLIGDSLSGATWYSEPHLAAEFTVNGLSVKISGAFRHRQCLRFGTSSQGFTNLTCSMCVQIPQQNDFKKRVLREDCAIEKRGCRSTAGGRRVAYLTVPELVNHARDMRKQLRLEKLNHWSARARIVQLKVKRPTLKEVAKQSSSGHNLLKFCNDVLNAHRTGAFGGRPALWDFIRDVAQNLNRDRRGHRYSENSKSFAQIMKVYGGKRMCDVFSLNYCGPNYSTVKRDHRKGVQFVPGEHEEIFEAVADIYTRAKLAHGIAGPIPVILAEDETKVKGRVAYEPKWDSLAGFCGPSLHHVCISSFKTVVGIGEEGYNQILNSFRNNKKGGFARVIIVNPLHDKLPRLVLVACCTCNCFDSAWVRRQWGVIDALWARKCLAAVGPVVGHSSDGDSRRRQLMLQDYRSLAGSRLSVGWEGWHLTCELDVQGNALGLHDQDYIHNGKKLINPLLSAVRVLQLGGDVCTHEHLGFVYNRFTADQHGLKQEDVDRRDRQNWASAQRICQLKVRQCLRLLRESPDVHRERCLGTETYLQVCAEYIDIFCSPIADLRSRLVLASKVSFFFRLWRLWLKHGDHSVLGNSKQIVEAQHFVSKQCFIDIQLSCTFVVLLICHFRDRYADLPVPLHLTGSDSCEIFFSKIGGMNGQERAYDFHELVNTANTLNQLSAIEYGENGLQFKKVHNKMENIWAQLHPLEEGQAPCDLGDYSLISSNTEVVEALKEGFQLAQRTLRGLNMAPTVHAAPAKKVWFVKPWVIEKEDSAFMGYTPAANPVRGEDGDGEVMRETLASSSVGPNTEPAEELEDELVSDGLDSQCVLEDETRDAVADLLSSHENQVSTPVAPSKILPVVEYGGHTIFKSTLVSQLNGNPFLSKDRLTRVKNSIYFNNHDDYVTAANCSSTCLLGLGSDCGIYFVQRSSTARTSAVKAVGKRKKGCGTAASKKGSPTNILSATDEGSWWIGRVQKMRRKVGTQWGLLRQPVDLLNRTAAGSRKNSNPSPIQVMLQYFSKAAGLNKFKYDHSDTKWVDIESIITTVTLSFNSVTSIYTVDPEDADALNKFVADRR